MTGAASAVYAGPALILSFVLAAFVVILSGLSFAEFASRIPVLGGAYSYVYVVFWRILLHGSLAGFCYASLCWQYLRWPLAGPVMSKGS